MFSKNKSEDKRDFLGEAMGISRLEKMVNLMDDKVNHTNDELRKVVDDVIEALDIISKRFDALESHMGVELEFEEAHRVDSKFKVTKKKGRK